MILPEMFGEVVTSREAVGSFAVAVVGRAVEEHLFMDGLVVPDLVRFACKRFDRLAPLVSAVRMQAIHRLFQLPVRSVRACPLKGMMRKGFHRGVTK